MITIILPVIGEIVFFFVVVLLAVIVTRKKPLEETTILDEPDSTEYSDKIKMVPTKNREPIIHSTIPL